MASRYIRKTVILAGLETVVGTDPVLTGAANAMKAFDVSISPVELKPIQLDYITQYFGSGETLAGSVYSKCSFSVSLSGSGTPATPPAWGAVLLACANSEVTGLLTPARVEYSPASDALKTLAIYWYDDGLLHKMLACFGNAKLSAKKGEAPKWMFEFTGLEVPAEEATNATAVMTAWKPPVAIRKANVADISLGCTYAAGALSSGTTYNSSGLMLDWGNKVAFDDLLSSEDIDLSDRKIKGSFSLKLSAAEEITFIDAVKNATLQSMGFVIGTVPGNKLMLYAPAMRLLSHKKEDTNGKRMVGFDFECNPVAGNDELRIVSL